MNLFLIALVTNNAGLENSSVNILPNISFFHLQKKVKTGLKKKKKWDWINDDSIFIFLSLWWTTCRCLWVRREYIYTFQRCFLCLTKTSVIQVLYLADRSQYCDLKRITFLTWVKGKIHTEVYYSWCWRLLITRKYA